MDAEQPNPPWLELSTEEYKALRAEIREATKAQQWVIGLTMAALGLIASQAVDLWRSALLSTAVFLVFVPILVSMFLLLWLGQLSSIVRKGAFLAQLEEDLHRLLPALPPSVFGWETYLRRAVRPWWTRLYEWTHAGFLGLMAVVGVGSLALGWYRAARADAPEVLSQDVIGLSVSALLAVVVAALLLAVVSFTGVSAYILGRRVYGEALDSPSASSEQNGVSPQESALPRKATFSDA